MTLLTKIQTLLSTWFPNKEQDQENFNEWIEQYFQYNMSTSELKINNNPIRGSIIWEPPLDGTDPITSWTTMTNTTGDGVFQSHGSFLTNGWSNAYNWRLEFDVQTDNWTYIGLMPICMEEINPFTDAKATSYALTSWEGISYFGGFGLSSWDSSISMSKITDHNTHHICITKLSSTKLKIEIDNTYVAIGNYNNLPNATVLHIGTRDNPSSRNYGGIINYSNIKVYRV